MGGYSDSALTPLLQQQYYSYKNGDAQQKDKEIIHHACVCVCVCVCVYVCVHVRVVCEWKCMHVCFIVHAPQHVSLCTSASVCVRQSVSVYGPACQCVHQCVSVCKLACVSVYASMCAGMHQSVPVHVSVYRTSFRNSIASTVGYVIFCLPFLLRHLLYYVTMMQCHSEIQTSPLLQSVLWHRSAGLSYE